MRLAPMSKTIALTAGLGLASGLSLSTSVSAGDLAFDGSKVRVNLSNKLNMLGQKVAAAACNIDAGFAVEDAKEELVAARRDFQTIMNGLENGDVVLGIPSAERRAASLRSIANVKQAWAPIDAAVEDMLQDQNIDAAASTIASANMPLLEATGILASDIVGQYSNPHEMTQSDAMSLRFAGRQRMISYQISKEVCGIATGTDAFGEAATLQEQVNMYGLSLDALTNGMAAAGINPPPNELITKELTKVSEEWRAEKASIETVLSGGATGGDQVMAVRSLSTDLVKDMNNVVTLYMLSSQKTDDVYRVALNAYAENELSKWLTNETLIEAIKAQNVAHASLGQDDIDALDQTWRAEAKADGGDLINDLIGRPASAWLRDNQNATAGFVTEVFAMDNLGLNVAQSVVTSDYWQGDEAKWKQTYGNGSGQMHVSEVELDESTGAYQTQVSLPIHDPETDEMIGAITFGINIQSLL
ncbi:MAG: type IV pili methyl-accepting chemotaxis transducer N-terminal domain-containing protein [Pseudomonadota bacterium]